MTLLTILGIATALAIVATIGLLWRDARKVPEPPVRLLGWHRSGEVVE